MCVCCVFVDVYSDNKQQKASYFRIKDEEVEEVVVVGCRSVSQCCVVLSPCHLISARVFYFLNHFDSTLQHCTSHFSVLSKIV